MGYDYRAGAAQPVRRRRAPRPALLGIRIGALAGIYAWRVRHHALQELLAGVAIATGVALLFGVLVSSQSTSISARRIVHTIVGSAELQLAARSQEGFDQRYVGRVADIPGVQISAPLLRTSAVIVGHEPHAIQLIGASTSAARLSRGSAAGIDTEHLGDGLALTSWLANHIGVKPGEHVTMLVRGRRKSLEVRTVWNASQVGALSESPVAIATLPVAQRAVGLPNRITQLLIRPKQGDAPQVRNALEGVASGEVAVQPATHELATLRATANPDAESAKLFVAIGLLFAISALFLTVPDRRRWIAEVRTQGYSAGQVRCILLLQAIVLGVTASVAGVLLGYLVARGLLGSLPDYLTLSRPIGSQPIVGVGSVAVAVGMGIFAASLPALAMLRDLSPRRAIDAALQDDGTSDHFISRKMAVVSAVAGISAVVAAISLALFRPQLSIISITLLVGSLLLIPAILAGVVWVLTPLSERMRHSMLAIALVNVGRFATKTIALASVAALAVFVFVAVTGARSDLVRALDTATVQLFEGPQVWIVPAGNNPLLTDGFDAGAVKSELERVPGVASVRTYQASLLEVGNRQLWIRARPTDDPTMIQTGQLVQGRQDTAEARIRDGGWAAVSGDFASEHRLKLGSVFYLPTPSGAMPERVAAITTNSGWPPGAVTISDPSYQRWWRTADPSALEVYLKREAGVGSLQAIRTLLASHGSLHAETTPERDAQNESYARQGVQNLVEISRLVLIIVALAIALALGITIVARRDDLAVLKTEGFSPAQLWRLLALESAIVLGVGALGGACLGIAGHALASRWLRVTRDFAAPFSLDPMQIFVALAVVGGVALVVLVAAGLHAARVHPRLPEQ